MNKVIGTDGLDYINIGPGATTQLGKLLNLSTEIWFTTPHGKCLTLIGYHYYNQLRHSMERFNVNPPIGELMSELLEADNKRCKSLYLAGNAMITAHHGAPFEETPYPAEWQIPSIYARLSMHPSPIYGFYASNVPIVYVDSHGHNVAESREGIRRYIDTIMRVRNEHIAISQ